MMTTSIASIVKTWVNDNTTEFPVDFDLLWQGLGYSRKDVAVRKFQEAGFVVHCDFRIIHKNVENSAGRPTQQYYLTTDAAKSFCMMANTDAGKIVRGYFLMCERELKNVLASTPTQTLTDAEVMELAIVALTEKAQQARFCEDKPGLKNIIKFASASQKLLGTANDSLADICRLHFDVELTTGQLSSLGRYVAGEYKAWHRQEPTKEVKLVDGSYRQLAVYNSSMYPTIENWLRHEGHIA